MPANFTRRRDLFVDAGIAEADAAVAALTQEVSALGLPADWQADTAQGRTVLREKLAHRLAQLPPEQRGLAEKVPAWLTEHAGDLTAVLWLGRSLYGASLDLVGFLLAILDALLATGQRHDAIAY